jgi:hypothetical protein
MDVFENLSKQLLLVDIDDHGLEDDNFRGCRTGPCLLCIRGTWTDELCKQQ